MRTSTASAEKYKCCFGPEDDTVNDLPPGDLGLLPNGKPRQKAKRTGSEALKRGCLSCFEAVTYEHKPDMLEIWYHSMAHLNAEGQICHGEGYAGGGKASLAPFLSDEVRETARMLVAAGMKNADIVRSVQEACIQRYKEARGFATIEATRQAIAVRTSVCQDARSCCTIT